jgi:DNA-binding NarL/FixJ family response regulator
MAVKILVVDDHPLIREALRQVLKVLDSQIELLEAADCSEGMAQATANPDLTLVLLDLSLPGQGGIDALPAFRERFPAVPVVVLSATDTPDMVMRAIDSGAMGFIPKTSSNQVLINALRLVLSGGVYLPLEMLRRGASADAAPPPPATQVVKSPRDIGLTARQGEVLALMLQGKPNKLICRDLNLAEGTVKIHVTAILKALGVANRTQAVIEVGRLGMKLEALTPSGQKSPPAAG